MKKIPSFQIVLASITMLFLFVSCKKDEADIRTPVNSYNLTVNWFRDHNTSNPTAFIDFYNGKAYTMEQVANEETPPIDQRTNRAATIDFFCFDRSAQVSSMQAIDFINMATFSRNDHPVYDSFNAVVGVINNLSAYNASKINVAAGVSVSEFNDIQYNDDITTLFNTKTLSVWDDMQIAASGLNDDGIVYVFTCAHNNKRGFFIISSSNYLPQGTMSIRVKVEK